MKPLSRLFKDTSKDNDLPRRPGFGLCRAGSTSAGTAPADDGRRSRFEPGGGVDRFLLRKLEESVAGRAPFWHREVASWPAYEQSLATNRQRLAFLLGVRDERAGKVELEPIATRARRPSGTRTGL